MGAGIIQLVARGIQDMYLTGDPQITFFKILYRRHTNFSIESVPQYFNSAANFGNTVSCTISRKGDLVGQIYLCVDIPPILISELTTEFITDNMESCADNTTNITGAKFAWVRNLGHAIIQSVSVEIGGKIIDKQYGEWMHIWAELTNVHDKVFDKMIGNIPGMYEFTDSKKPYRLHIPLYFWFCKNHGLALPLIALASAEVKIIVTFRQYAECCRIGPTHSIEIMEDIVPFNHGDYIEQIVNNKSIFGYVMSYDYLSKRLKYIKISDCPKKKFESVSSVDNDTNTLFSQFRPSTKPNYTPNHQNHINHQSHTQSIPYRIYNSVTKEYCTPAPGSVEHIEHTVHTQGQFNNRMPCLGSSFLYVDYVYLDNDERKMFVAKHHDYLIEQIQFNQELVVKDRNIKQDLTLNHCCKSHYWVAQMSSLVGAGTINDTFNFTSSHIRLNNELIGTNLVEKSELLLSGYSRYGERDSTYTNLIEPYSHHRCGPSVGINVYSPSVYPENHQPSSSINMSKIDQICMQMKLSKNIGASNTAKIRSYTINYNILKIAFNMGGLMFE